MVLNGATWIVRKDSYNRPRLASDWSVDVVVKQLATNLFQGSGLFIFVYHLTPCLGAFLKNHILCRLSLYTCNLYLIYLDQYNYYFLKSCFKDILVVMVYDVSVSDSRPFFNQCGPEVPFTRGFLLYRIFLRSFRNSVPNMCISDQNCPCLCRCESET